MSPRDLDADVVHERLVAIRELLTDLGEVGAVSAADLEGDRMLRHAVERILSQVVELAVSVNSHVAATELGKAPGSYGESFDVLRAAGVLPTELSERLRRSVGLRNVLAHEYVRIDLAIVAGAVTAAQPDYAEYVQHVAGWLHRRTGD